MKNDPAADQINEAKKYVVSESLTHSDWKNTIILNDNPLQKIQRLKEEQAPDLLVHASSHLIQSLLKNNLIDEVTIWTFPLLLRQGKKLFTEDINAQGLELVQNTVSTTGVIISTYRLNKKIKPGSFAFDQTTD